MIEEGGRDDRGGRRIEERGQRTRWEKSQSKKV